MFRMWIKKWKANHHKKKFKFTVFKNFLKKVLKKFLYKKKFKYILELFNKGKSEQNLFLLVNPNDQENQNFSKEFVSKEQLNDFLDQIR